MQLLIVDEAAVVPVGQLEARHDVRIDPCREEKWTALETQTDYRTIPEPAGSRLEQKQEPQKARHKRVRTEPRVAVPRRAEPSAVRRTEQSRAEPSAARRTEQSRAENSAARRDGKRSPENSEAVRSRSRSRAEVGDSRTCC